MFDSVQAYMVQACLIVFDAYNSGSGFICVCGMRLHATYKCWGLISIVIQTWSAWNGVWLLVNDASVTDIIGDRMLISMTSCECIVSVGDVPCVAYPQWHHWGQNVRGTNFPA